MTTGQISANKSRSELVSRYPGYHWMIERQLVGQKEWTALQPWYFVPERDMFWATDHWPSGPSEAPLLVFGRRQDCDDLVCFKDEAKKAGEIVVIHGWASGSYVLLETYPTFWGWLKSVVDDIEDWSSRAAESDRDV